MGWLSRWRVGRAVVDSAVRASACDLEIGRPPIPPADGMAPLLADVLFAGPGERLLSRRMALSVPAVRRGVRIITGAIASMPLQRRRDLDVLEAGVFLTHPEADRPYSATLTRTVEDLIFHPHAWWYVTDRDRQGFPARVVRLEPEYVSFRTVSESGQIEDARATYRGRPIDEAQLIRFDGPDEGLLLLGVVEITTALKLELAARTYATPETPTGVLKYTGQHTLEQAELDALGISWDVHRRARTTAVLPQNMDYTAVLSTPEQLQLVEGREESAAQIARLLNLPARYLAAKSGDSMTYSNVASERRDLVDLSLAPYMQAIEQRLSMWDTNGTPRGQSVVFDTSALLRADARERAEIGEILIRSGQSVPNEQRAQNGLKPLPAPKPAPVPPPPPPSGGDRDQEQERDEEKEAGHGQAAAA